MPARKQKSAPAEGVDPEQQLAGFLAKFTPGIAAEAEAYLGDMRRLYPTALELVYDNYNALAIGFSPTERASDGIFSIAVYPRWVSLFFLQARALADPDQLLRGSGSMAKHIVLAPDTLRDKRVRALMGEAEALAKAPFDRKGKHRLVIKSISAKQRPRGPGKERDSESGNDYFGARYYAATMGRWISPDPTMQSAILELPQTWNMYSYEYNRPLYGTDPDGRCPPCVGAIVGGVVGGVVEGGWNLVSQLSDRNGADWDISKVKWGTVGANAAGGFVAGGLAGATGGLSLLAEVAVGGTLAVDVAIGGVSSVAGGIATRGLDPNDQNDDTWDVGEISKDALSGFVGGGVGHFAAALTHEPIDLGRGPTRGVRKIRAFKQAVSQENNLRNLSLGVGTAAGSPPTHATNWFMNDFWNSWDWLVMSSQNQDCAQTSATDSQGNTTGWSGCQ